MTGGPGGGGARVPVETDFCDPLGGKQALFTVSPFVQKTIDPVAPVKMLPASAKTRTVNPSSTPIPWGKTKECFVETSWASSNPTPSPSL
ncbi:hypothetical protein FJTKL_09222 [Diaporthe vaccinii]|uniref:Uncharacterized protein n=1 Tax=Diaporthe vaccinii TaxID=105482 RepID=A0ABR4ENI5_9PEZI